MRKYACLMYHEIAYPYRHPFYVHPVEFKKQVDWLVKNGYKSIDLRKGDDNGNVLITFDDGHKSNLDAARYLHSKGMVAVFYLLKNFSLEDPEYLNEDDIKEIASLGHIIGIHGKNHFWWTRKSEDVLVRELNETAKWIESLTGLMPITCSAPGGLIRDREYTIIRKRLSFIKYIRSSFHGFNKTGDTNLKSKGVGTMTSMEEFEKIVKCDTMYYLKATVKCWIKDRIKDVILRFKTQHEKEPR